MTIRRTLLLAFLLVGLTPALLLAGLGFQRAGGALQAEIQRGLAAQADALLSDVNRLVYERLQNAASWRRTEPMQDLQVGDVDKRLADFLRRVAAGYGGLYQELVVVDAQGRRVASSLATPEAAALGQPAAPGQPWQTLRLADAPLTLDLLPAAASTRQLRLRTPVPSSFGGGTLGELQLLIDWTQIDRLLEPAAAGGRRVALLDREGRLLAGSAEVLARLPRLHAGLAPLARGETASGAAAGSDPLGLGPALQGLGRERPLPGFEGLGWRLLVLVPRDEALGPVRAMGWIFALLLAGVAALTVLASGGISRALARPLLALTDFARRWRLGQVMPPAAAPQPVQGRLAMGELAELQQAFVQMVRENEQQQQALARTTALAAVGEMSAILAHEVRTPLGIVLSSAQIVQREPHLSAEGRELLGYIESETERLGRLVSTMLESTRPRPPLPETTDMAALIRHAAGLLSGQAARQQVQVVASLPDEPLDADCDAEQMIQVLLNLILNGLQILAQGGRIEIGARRAVDPAGGDTLVIEIADDGPGIEPAARERIFEAFYFQREGGIGLGLAVVQKIVNAHGGRIEAGSSPLGGALFRIHLPCRMSGPPAASAG